MRNRTLGYITLLLFSIMILSSGCARPKNWLISEHETITAFSFGKAGGLTIGVSKYLDIDGHPNSLLLPIITQVFQDSLRARGLEVGEAKPVEGVWGTLVPLHV